MELNVINELGQEAAKPLPLTPCSAANTTKLWCTSSWLLTRLTPVRVRALSSAVSSCATRPL